MATLRLDTGYLRTANDWSGEARTPTRLGEPTITLRLARLDGSSPRAWHTDLPPRFHWPLSQLSVARRLVCAPAEEDDALRSELEASQPFVGDDVVTVILRKTGPTEWNGRALAERTQSGAVSSVPVRLSYSEQRGLEILQEA
jgi:CRISPR-associated endonuclease/helicase Cas3